MDNNKYLRTDNFYLASFLFACGSELVNIDRTINKKRAYFVFIYSPEAGQLMEIFNFAKEDDPAVCVDARKLITAVRQLKEKLYSKAF